MAIISSPRKRAPAFAQTWNEDDAAFLDPSSLPIAKLPRAWDRKPEVKVSESGKQKKVWRTYATKTRPAGATADADEEDLDSRSRAVKRQQRMSPKAMEKATKSRSGKTRAFKGTRYDRRKSVLPRKKVAGAEAADVAEEDEEEEDTTITESSNASFSALSFDVEMPKESTPLREGDDRRATISLLFEGKGDESDQEDLDKTLENSADVSSIACATSPSAASGDKTTTTQSPSEAVEGQPASTKSLPYPELPKTDDSDDTPADVVQMAKECTKDPETPRTPTETSAPATAVTPVPIEQSEEGMKLTVEGEVKYPQLPNDLLLEDAASNESVPGESRESESQEDTLENEEFTEESLQLDLHEQVEPEDIESASTEAEEMPELEAENMDSPMTEADEDETAEQSTPEDFTDDIASGLTLDAAPVSSREPTPRKLRSPSPPPRTESGPEDATMTLALDDDTALLKDFLSRAAASKANKAANIARRESLQNRRDSDVVRHALASPRKVLEDKDPNSPTKQGNDATLDLSDIPTLSVDAPAVTSPTEDQTKMEVEAAEAPKAEAPSRRSQRARTSRLPAPSSIPTGPPKIAVRRADGGEPVVLKKTEAQELLVVTRANTKKNKQGAQMVNVRLLKLNGETHAAIDDTAEKVQIPGKKYVQWDSQLTYFQEDTRAVADMAAEAESLAMPDELSIPAPSLKPPKPKAAPAPKPKSNTTPKVRKLKKLGSANGTPGKALQLSGSLLPDSMLDEEEQKEPEKLKPKSPKSTRTRKMPVAGTDAIIAPEPQLASLDIMPVGIVGPPSKHKSRLAAPKKVKLPQPASSTTAVGAGKENARTSIAAATAKKGIPVPSTGTSIESGLPRKRSARRM